MWWLQALGACLCFTAMLLILKRASESGISSAQVLAWVYFSASLIFIVHLLSTRQTLLHSYPTILLLLLASVLSYIGNNLQVKALAAAPNPGYAVAIVNLDALLLTFVAVFMLGVEITTIKVIGTVFCVIGASLVVL